MFTGLIEDVGKVVRFEKRGASARAVIATGFPASDPLELGESIAVNGVCLTVDKFSGMTFEADLSAETLAVSTLSGLTAGASVNLERSMKLGGRMGGHIVLGHVDGIGSFVRAEAVSGAQRTEFRVGRGLSPYLAHKGSICIDGVSLTINDVTDSDKDTTFSVMLVPHTLGRTTLASLQAGAQVNIEIDVLARYVERRLSTGTDQAPRAKDESSLLEKLRDGSYI
ncbi:MAG: riboflavin synthase [Myxococcales bacterium]|nr:riboflavin synthase [Myxococcales bacterium]